MNILLLFKVNIRWL